MCTNGLRNKAFSRPQEGRHHKINIAEINGVVTVKIIPAQILWSD
jgi:hypothetical protein